MKNNRDEWLILVVVDDEEMRDGIERLLSRDAYRVNTARHELDAVRSARQERPHLILVSLAGTAASVVAIAERVRARAEIDVNAPVVVFSADAVPEGAEVQVGANVYATSPGDFDQLRAFIARLLDARRS
jgi:DNA-binding response OmpR family regulator